MWTGLILAGGAVWLGFYVWDQGFTGKWRGLIAKELAKHGLRAEIGRLTLDPVDGLTARDVKLYDTTQRGQHLADIDRISLEIDVARLMNQEDFLRTIHLQRADVSLPVDPSDPRSEWLLVKDLNARLVFQKDEIEIARAEGLVSGIQVKASGTVRKPPPLVGNREQKDRMKEERTRQLREMRDRRGLLRSLLRGLERFSIPLLHGLPERANKAEITLELQGDLSDIDRMELRAVLSAGPLVHRGGRLEGIGASARLSEGLLTLQRLDLKDSQGALHAAASWKIRQAPAVDFAVDCTMDLQAVLRSALDDAPWLGEVVCYTPPEWSWNGRLLTHAGAGAGAGALPVEGQGHLKAGRFSTRGMVFDGLEAKVALKADGQIYVRNGLLLHHSGEVRGQLLWGPQQSRYEVDWRMSFHPVRPFLTDAAVQSFLERFSFDQASRIAVSLQGDRRVPSSPWRHAGRFDLRDFSWQGTPLKEVGGSIAFNAGAEVPLVFRDAVLEMSDGLGKAREVQLDLPRGLLTLVGGEATLRPAPLLHLFHPPLGRALGKYRFERPPESRMEGVVDLKNQGRSDYRITLRTRSRCGLDLAGRPMEFDDTAGTLHVLGEEIGLQMTGSTAPGTESFQVLRFEDPAPASFAGTFSLDPAKPQASWKVDVRAPGRVSLKVLDRTWPLEQFAGGLETAGAGFTGAGGARLLDGKFGVSLDFPDAGSVAHQGSIVVRNVSFAQLSAIVDPSRKTAGRLTGSFSYNIPNPEPGSLSGKGEATLEDANLFALPLLGPLSPMVDALIPGGDIISSTARTATSTLTVAGGKVTLPDFTASTDAFKLTVTGSADYLKNRVDFLGRVNLRGAPGVLLYPVSKLFEYAADGTLPDPAWHPRFFAGPFRNKPAAQDPLAGPEPPSLVKEPETVNPPRPFRPRRGK